MPHALKQFRNYCGLIKIPEVRFSSEENHERAYRFGLHQLRNCPSLRENAWVCALLQAFVPPSTVRFAPVMYEDSGPATNATRAATSSTRP